MKTKTSLLHFLQRNKCFRISHSCFPVWDCLSALWKWNWIISTWMTALAGLSVKLALFRNLFKTPVPTSVYLLDMLRDCIRLSWCICTCNRDSCIGPSPAAEPIWMVCLRTAMSISNVRSIIIEGLKLFVLNKISLVHLAQMKKSSLQSKICP